jgi:3-oxoacyl-[acyl-carrier protein] reductase
VKRISNTDFDNLSPLKLVLAGGCGGIGRAVAHEAKRQGMDIAILDLPASIERHRVDDLPHFTLDAKEPDSVEHATAQAAAQLGGIDACVNLIGFMTAPQSLASTSIDTWKDVIHGNLDAAFYVSRAVLPHLHESDRGALVHIASGLGAWARPNFGAYGPAKAGIILLTRQLALENAPAVRVNAVAPGAVDTAFLRGGTGRSDEQEAPALNPTSYGQSVPLGRIANPQDIVGPVMFLLSDAAGYMTGQTLHVNGGTYMP